MFMSDKDEETGPDVSEDWGVQPDSRPLPDRFGVNFVPDHVSCVTKRRVVHCKREPYDVYIGRPSRWGNPFVIGRDGTREQVIEKYRQHVTSRADLMAALPELHGKVLGCWCAPAACHGDVLAELCQRDG
jgi:hypothetical protein